MVVMALGVRMDIATNGAVVGRNGEAESVTNHCHSMVGVIAPFWALTRKLLHVIHMNVYLLNQYQVIMCSLANLRTRLHFTTGTKRIRHETVTYWPPVYGMK